MTMEHTTETTSITPGMSLQRAIDRAHSHLMSSHIPGWKENREALRVLLAHLKVPTLDAVSGDMAAKGRDLQGDAVQLEAAARAMHAVCDGGDRWNRLSNEARAQWIESVRPVVAALAAQPKGDSLVRYCPECSSIGDVQPGARDCCPDGSAARRIPKHIAEASAQLNLIAMQRHPAEQTRGYGVTDLCRAALEHISRSIDKQLDLLNQRAKGDLLDKAPIMRTLRLHKQRAEQALAAQPMGEPVAWQCRARLGGGWSDWQECEREHYEQRTPLSGWGDGPLETEFRALCDPAASIRAQQEQDDA